MDELPCCTIQAGSPPFPTPPCHKDGRFARLSLSDMMGSAGAAARETRVSMLVVITCPGPQFKRTTRPLCLWILALSDSPSSLKARPSTRLLSGTFSQA